MNRRTLLVGAAASIAGAPLRYAAPAKADEIVSVETDAAMRFTSEHVLRLAEELAARPYEAQASAVSEALKDITYDQYRDIRFPTEKAIWRGEGIDFQLQLLPVAWIYNKAVAVYIVSDGTAREIKDAGNLFSMGPLIDEAAGQPAGISGFRIHAPINRADYFDEVAVFQGASYFRAVARGLQYGLSARGLAIDTAEPTGEEFPSFRSFWIEKPSRRAGEIVVHALLDSASVAGAYRFTIVPGATTVMDVEATLYPRRELARVGLGPLTSMFLTGAAQLSESRDFRPSVHDSQGLAILNGRGEHIWRPLANSKTLQSSAFMDRGPRAFGLIQRDRRFSSYEDLEARYDLRPSSWVEPKGDWGKGSVRLIEIPTTVEIHDNIVCFWQPADPIPAGKPYAFAYRLHWGKEWPAAGEVARVAQTRVGKRAMEDTSLVIVDFEGGTIGNTEGLPRVELKSSGVPVTLTSTRRNPVNGGIRVSFHVGEDGPEVSELRLALFYEAKQASETWLYRWITG